MTRFLQNRAVRIWAAAALFLCVVIAAGFGMMEKYGRSNSWYYLGRGAGFDQTDACASFVRAGNYYVEQNVRWLEDMTLEGLGSYAGRAYSYIIRDEQGNIMADTTTRSSVYVEATGYSPVADSERFTVEGYINLPVEPYDGCYKEFILFETFFPLRYLLIVLKVLFILLSVLSALVLAAGAAVRGRTLGLSPALRKPFDAMLLAELSVYAIVRLILYFIWRAFWTKGIYWQGPYNWDYFLSFWTDVGYDALCAVVLILTLAAAVWYMAGQIGARCLAEGLFLRRLPPSLVIVVFAVVHLVLIFLSSVYEESIWNGTAIFNIGYSSVRTARLILVLTDIALVPLLIFYARDTQRVSHAAKELSEGNLYYKTDADKLHLIWRTLGERLNGIGDGMAQAVDARMRSERMKTELITNVSHDLKTPLTSVINYVGLLKSDDLTREERTEYLDILDRQTQKLKKLTEDVLEASKAASGAITVEREPIDAAELLDQLLGEYDGKLAGAQITPVLTAPEEETLILADGVLLGRVLENLISNVVKYAQPGTRAYFDVKRAEGHVVIEVKNVSRDALNISADELMERFVRGDSSRHSEGSGLGLSIAKSLAELMGGALELTIDGDLFTAEVSLEAVTEAKEETQGAVV